jgi:IS5 family transposase
VDWYYGFKLHLIVDDEGEILSFCITPANIDDRKALKMMTKDLKGKLFGDKGYLSKELQEELWKKGIQLITRVRKNMKEKPLETFDKILLRKRSIIETVIGQLKRLFTLEHTRCRSLVGFFVNTLCSLIAYSWQSKKPSLSLRNQEDVNVPLILSL